MPQMRKQAESYIPVVHWLGFGCIRPLRVGTCLQTQGWWYCALGGGSSDSGSDSSAPSLSLGTSAQSMVGKGRGHSKQSSQGLVHRLKLITLHGLKWFLGAAQVITRVRAPPQPQYC